LHTLDILTLKKMVDWGKNAAKLGEFLLVVLLWISTWSLIELPIETYIKKFWIKMVIYGVIFVVVAIIILLLADRFAVFTS